MKTIAALTLLWIMLCGSLCEEAGSKNWRPKRSKINSVLSWGPTILRELSNIWHTLLRNPSLSVDQAIFRNREHEIIGRITEVNRNVLHLEYKINRIYGDVVGTIISTLPDTIRTELKLDQMTQIMNEIDIAQNEFRDYFSSTNMNETFRDAHPTEKTEHSSADSGGGSDDEEMDNEIDHTTRSPVTRSTRKPGKIERSTLLNFATWATGPGSDSVKTLLGRLHRTVVPKNQFERGILNLLGRSNTLSIGNYVICATQMVYILISMKAAAICGATGIGADFDQTASVHGRLGIPDFLKIAPVKRQIGSESMNKLFVVLYAIVVIDISKNVAQRPHRSKTFGNTELSEQIRATYELFDRLWGRLSETNSVSQNMLPRDLIHHFIEIDNNVTRIESGMNDKDFFVLSSMWNFAQAEADAKSVTSYYDTFKKLQDNVKKGVVLSQLAWTDLAETFLQNNQYGLIKIIDNLHHHVTDSDPSDLFDLARQELGTAVCNFNHSPHQVLYNLHNAVTMADYKGYIMLQFSYMILRLYDKGNFTVESERETQKFQQRAEEKSFAIRNALTNADRSKYNCDPKQYVEGLNYVKLTNLLQGYIENEVNLNPYGTCRENCAYYYYTEYHGCFKEQFCSKQEQCRGKVVECKYVDSDMNICKSSDPERRYDWVEYENSNVLGTKGKCQTRNLFKVDSWWRYLFWHCSYCLCLCDNGNHNSDRYFNLREVTSDVEQNKVITGVRIVKHNRIIHLQIQQGVLQPRGVIDKSTLSWKAVDNYTIYDTNVQNGIDYHTMNWMDRAIDTDEATGPNEHVLTGIRLRKLGNHLNLEIRTTPINFTTGQVYPEVHSLWQGNDNTEVSISNPRKEIILTNPDIPIRNGPHTKDSEHNQYIKFQATSFESDVAQNTVPYLDGQALVSHGFPLSGFGFVHRGKPGSGGFIAPKVITYNFRPHV